MEIPSLIHLFYGAAATGHKIRIGAPGIGVEESGARDSLRAAMQQKLVAFTNWAARVYEELPPGSREAVLSWLHAFEGEIVQAYRQEHWATFQSALAQTKTLIAGIQDRQIPKQALGQHWTCRAWSRVLDAEVWFVCCEQEVAPLTKQGLSRGAIYTEAELRELLRLPQPSSEALKDLHLVKGYFDATLAPNL